jgi:DNA-binding NtrC family response regulator
MINEGRFREDLYYRLAQSRVVIPPLRDRVQDVPVLVSQFLRRISQNPRCAQAIAPEAMAQLMARDYPGNVRELKSVVERAALMADGGVIRPVDLAFERMLDGERNRALDAFVSSARASTPPDAEITPFKESKRTLIDEFERNYLQRLLARSDDNLSFAASIAGVDRSYLRNLLRKHGLRSTSE